MAISQVAALSGAFTGTSATVSLPTYLTSDYIVLVVASNNANAQTFGANVTATALATAANRLNVWRIAPQDGAQTTFTVAVGVSSVLTWWIVTLRGVDPGYVVGAANPIGNSTTAPVEAATTTASWLATGNELVLSAGGVNSTATWTPTGSTLFNTTTGNAALMVNGSPMTAGSLTVTPAALDRGLGGTSRNESAVTLVLSPAGDARAVNRLTNPSFEDAAATATGWETEKTVLGTPAYTKVTSPVADGGRAQQMQYAGQPGDAGLFAIYQSPITAAPGEILTFKVSLAGSKANCSLIVGIEGFATGQVYISETDTSVIALTGSMVEYVVTYTVPPTAVAVAVYIQANEVTPSTALTAQIDKASLVQTGTAPAAVSSAFLAFFGDS